MVPFPGNNQLYNDILLVFVHLGVFWGLQHNFYYLWLQNGWCSCVFLWAQNVLHLMYFSLGHWNCTYVYLKWNIYDLSKKYYYIPVYPNIFRVIK